LFPIILRRIGGLEVLLLGMYGMMFFYMYIYIFVNALYRIFFADVSVGDADNFRFFHTPLLGGWHWPLKFRKVPTLNKGCWMALSF